MKADPPPRKNCAQCGKPRNAQWNQYAKDQALFDPFCSSSCAREFHGTQIPQKERGKIVT